MNLAPLASPEDFPALATGELAYLDNAATTQKPRAVLDAIASFYARGCANVGRGVHAWAEHTTQAYEHARTKLAAFVGANANELVFTGGTTHALNLVAQGWARPRVQAGDRVVCTYLEHHANFLPWQALAADAGARFELLALDAAGNLDLDDAARKLEGAALLALTACSNVLGVCPPVAALVELARARGVCTVVDAAQLVPHQPLSFAQLGCDFMAFSGHKMFGPMGIGALVGRRERLAELEPQRLGGGMVMEVGETRSSWRELPARLEGGTPNVAGAVGLAAAVDYIEGLGRERIAAHTRALTTALVTDLHAREGVSVLGPSSGGHGIVSFNLGTHHPHDVAALLDERGVAVRAGLHCAQPLLRTLGVSGTVRVSFSAYNGGHDLECLSAGLDHVTKVLG